MREKEDLLDEILRLVSEQTKVSGGILNEEETFRTERIEELFERIKGND